MKTCSKCGIEKSRSEFHKRATKYCKDGLRPRCKSCRKEDNILNRRVTKNRMLLRTYGITIEEFEQMKKDQKGVCKICKSIKITEYYKDLVVDHCHKTGKVRGLLCNRCNRSLGMLEENIEILEQMIKYIKKHSTT